MNDPNKPPVAATVRPTATGAVVRPTAVAARRPLFGRDNTGLIVTGLQQGMVVLAVVGPGERKGAEIYTPEGGRPWIILSRTIVARALPTLLAVPLTSKLQTQNGRYTGYRIVINAADFELLPLALPHPQFTFRAIPMLAKTDQVRELDHSRIKGDPLAILKKDKLIEVTGALQTMTNVF